MKKIYIALAIVLILGVSFVVVIQIRGGGELYTQTQRLLAKTCPAYFYVTGEYTGTVPEVAAIKTEVNSLGFEKTGVKQLENKKIQVIIAGVDDTQMADVSERVSSALSKLGNFQLLETVGTGASKARSCPLD